MFVAINSKSYAINQSINQSTMLYNQEEEEEAFIHRLYITAQ